MGQNLICSEPDVEFYCVNSHGVLSDLDATIVTATSGEHTDHFPDLAPHHQADIERKSLAQSAETERHPGRAGLPTFFVAISASASGTEETFEKPASDCGNH